MYIWQGDNWPEFVWDDKLIMESLLLAKKNQGYVLGIDSLFDLKELGDIITTEAITTSAIEGEMLDKDSIRSSVAKRLGLPTAGLPVIARKTDGLVELLLDATTNFNIPLTEERVFSWHAALFPTGYSGMNKIEVGGWRCNKLPMEVISGSLGKEKVHYVAPESSIVSQEMESFFEWWESTVTGFDGIIRAAIAHLWFVTIHPFEDGNGRIARCITDMALAMEEKTGKRLYSLSSHIIKEKTKYYSVLELTQKGSGDITEWLIWFLEMFSRSVDNSKILVERLIYVNGFYTKIAGMVINERQMKVLKKLLESYPDGFIGGLTNKKYVSITGTSSETAKRDINDLLIKGLLVKNDAGGRSTSYRLV